ncbi:MAG: hypothetical protein ACOYIF_09720 [Acetivibrionales bacterium]|jgi:hypothetical protein
MDKISNGPYTGSPNDQEEAVLIEGEFNNKVFIIGIVLSALCIITSLISLSRGKENTLAGFDYIILITSAYFLALSVKEVSLNRNRRLSVTENRIFGNTGSESFDLLHSDIVSIEQKTKKNVLYGNIQYLHIKTKMNTELSIEQLRNLEKVLQVIKSKR